MKYSESSTIRSEFRCRMTWKPLAVRNGEREPDGPFEGIPRHLEGPLKFWLEELLKAGGRFQESLAVRLSSMLRVSFKRDRLSSITAMHVLAAISGKPDGLLDAADGALHLESVSDRWIDELDRILLAAGSVWTVSADRRSLIRRVDRTAVAAYEAAAEPSDVASAELRAAWAACFGRSADASDAWDHAIKAVEAVAIPLVAPKQDKAQLGHVVGQLDSQGGGWTLDLSTQQGIGSIEVLVGMLRLIWPNPDRHGGVEHRVPSISEAQAVVHLAVTIVQWIRMGSLSRTA